VNIHTRTDYLALWFACLRVYMQIRAARVHTPTASFGHWFACLLARVQMLHTYAVEFCPPVLCLRARACTYKVSRPLVHSLLLRPLPISAAYDRVYSLSLSCSSSPLWRVSAVVGGVYSVQWLFGREKIIASDMVIPSDWSRGDLMRLQLTANERNTHNRITTNTTVVQSFSQHKCTAHRKVAAIGYWTDGCGSAEIECSRVVSQ